MFNRVLPIHYTKVGTPFEIPLRVGVGGTQVFTFIADYAGDDVLSFVYATPWGETGGYYAIRVIAYF